MVRASTSQSDSRTGTPGIPLRGWRRFSPLPGRLSRPRLPLAFVPRPRLIHSLDAGTRGPVTLVTAGAGWGKTLLAASWIATGAPPGPVGWLSLGAEDNSRTRLWSDVITTLEMAGAIPDDHELAEVGAGLRASPTLVERVVHGLDRLPGPAVLVLDDLDEIVEPTVMADLGALLRARPARLHLVVLTRAEPALPLHRLRAAGELREIRPSDLEFTLDEAAELMARYNLRITRDHLEDLLDRTEGWAAGLQLSAMVLSTSGGRDGGGGDSAERGIVADYLMREVVERQPEDIRRFLRYTSLADELSGSLADAITGGTHGQRTLERLERDNLFVVGLGERPGHFRYHHLLRDLLRHQLTVDEPDMIAELNLRAARWYAGRGAVIKAISHAAAAGDWPLVGRLAIPGAAPALLAPSREALARALKRIPADQFPTTAELTLCAALSMFDARSYDVIPSLTARARALLEGRPKDDRQPVEVALRTLDLAVARVRSDVTALAAASTDVLDLLATVAPAQLPTVLQYRAVASGNLGVAMLWTGQLDRADLHLSSAAKIATTAGVDLVEINALGHLALLGNMRGLLREAHAGATAALDLTRRRGWQDILQAVPAMLGLAMVAFERRDLAAARRSVTDAQRAHNADPEVAMHLVLGVLRARLALAGGDLRAARSVLEQTRLQTQPGQPAMVLARWLLMAEAECDLAAGNPERALTRLAGSPREDHLSSRERVYRARAYLALGDLDRADAELSTVRTSSADVLAAVEAWTVTALLGAHREMPGRAADALANALALAEPEQIRRPFLDIAGTRLLPLVGPRRNSVPRSEFLADLVVRIPNAREWQRPSAGGALSERELEVLQYLPTVLNATEIADELHVSVNTVKAHLRSIYRKLAASRRREAVDRARALGLL